MVSSDARGSTFGTPGTGPIHMDDVHCRGTETRLSDCPHNANHNCGHYEDAGITCQPRTSTISPFSILSHYVISNMLPRTFLMLFIWLRTTVWDTTLKHISKAYSCHP